MKDCFEDILYKEYTDRVNKSISTNEVIKITRENLINIIQRDHFGSMLSFKKFVILSET